MKLIYLDATGIAKVEGLKPKGYQFIEHYDGYHPINTDCIYRDRDHRQESIILIWQGIAIPEGGKFHTNPDGYSKDAIHRIAQRFHRQKTKISKLWIRKLINYVFWFFRIMVFGFLVSFFTLWILIFLIALGGG